MSQVNPTHSPDIAKSPYAPPTAQVLMQVQEQATERPSLFGYRGRINRARFITTSLFCVFLVFLAHVLGVLYFFFFVLPANRTGPNFGWTFYQPLSSTSASPLFYMNHFAIAGLVIIFTILCIQSMRRFRDFNFSGWWTLLNLIPVVNLVTCLVLCIIPGSNDSNRFGKPNPVNTWKQYLTIGLWPVMAVAAYFFTSYMLLFHIYY